MGSPPRSEVGCRPTRQLLYQILFRPLGREHACHAIPAGFCRVSPHFKSASFFFKCSQKVLCIFEQFLCEFFFLDPHLLPKVQHAIYVHTQPESQAHVFGHGAVLSVGMLAQNNFSILPIFSTYSFFSFFSTATLPLWTPMVSETKWRETKMV